ncbi:uncharacterized protein [Typha latifolia]|uniref:uncharacterized protein n=1 Tax=Typha latifolia TaxID=4733 RepID=UPI003C2B6280
MAAHFAISPLPTSAVPVASRQPQLQIAMKPCGLRLVHRNQFVSTRFTVASRGYSRTTISCSSAQPETLQIVQDTIAKQLSIEESTVTSQTKFADLGADSLDTVEIMMALEEKFGVAIGEGGAENIATVQDAADLIEKVKAEGG